MVVDAYVREPSVTRILADGGGESLRVDFNVLGAFLN